MVRFKALSILFTIIILFSILIVPVSANSEVPDYPLSAELPPISLQSGQKALLYYRYEVGVWGYVLCDVSGNENTAVLPENPGQPEQTGFLNVDAIGVYELDGYSWVPSGSSSIQVNFYPYAYTERGRIIVSVSQGIHDNIYFTVDSSNWKSYFLSDYDTWYDNIFSGITNWFSGVLEVLSIPFTAIADGLAGLWEEVGNLADTIKEDLKSLFIPSVNIVPLIFNKFADKFPIINQVVDLFSSLYNIGTDEPIFKITYNGMTLKIIDFTMFSGYLPLIRNFTGVFLLLSFLTREVKKLPRLLRGRD